MALDAYEEDLARPFGVPGRGGGGLIASRPFLHSLAFERRAPFTAVSTVQEVTFTVPFTGKWLVAVQGCGGTGSGNYGGSGGGLAVKFGVDLTAGAAIPIFLPNPTTSGSGNGPATITLPSGLVLSATKGGINADLGGIGSGGDVNLRGGRGGIGNVRSAELGEGPYPPPIGANGGGAPGVYEVPRIRPDNGWTDGFGEGQDGNTTNRAPGAAFVFFNWLGP